MILAFGKEKYFPTESCLVDDIFDYQLVSIDVDADFLAEKLKIVGRNLKANLKICFSCDDRDSRWFGNDFSFPSLGDS